MMTPQLFINYKLKSVAHLPWRMLTYKALNTFIDDIFAFVIKMPTLYRIGCLRDGGYKLTEEWENWRLFYIDHVTLYEPPRGKTNNLHMRKQRRRSASR